MSEDKRFYGIYEGVCTNNVDPDNKHKIKLQVPQVLGTAETDWAKPCLPVTSNSNHPDHIPHTAVQVAALLATPASVTVTNVTSSGTSTIYTYASTTQKAVVGAGVAVNGGIYTISTVATVIAGSYYSFTCPNTPYATTALAAGTGTAYLAYQPIVPQSSNTLAHPHVKTVSQSNLWNDSSGSAFNDLSSTLEHTPHRLVPSIGQKVWVMFTAGDPNYPVWLGVEL
jgi:hypothetical protein